MDKLNIEEILRLNGYELVEHYQDYKILRIRFSIQKLKNMLKEKELYDYDLTGIFEVEITQVGFNGYGGLYVVLESTGFNGYFEAGDTFDVLENDN